MRSINSLLKLLKFSVCRDITYSVKKKIIGTTNLILLEVGKKYLAGQKTKPDVGVEPTTLRLRVSRSTD
jgi:hypothetical protein